MLRFALLFDEIDRTTSTNAKVAALARYFAEAPAADAAWAVYFLTGRRLKRLVSYIAINEWTLAATELPGWLLEECYSVVGDGAETAALVLDQLPTTPGDDLPLARWLEERILPLRQMDPATQQARVTEALQEFADNTLRYLRDEGKLLAEGIDFPALETSFRDRHALVVARGPGYKRDLKIVRGYVRDFRPVLVAVDGGAEALIEEGWKPDVIVGDMDSVTDATLRSGAEILVHAYREGHAPGEARLQRLDVPFHTVAAPGISEDIALLLAHDKGAELIVAVGTHFNLVEFLERSRAGMSSTFVTRLKVGEILIDAKGVSRLVSRRIGVWPLALFGIAALAALLVAILASPALRNVFGL